MRYLVFSSLRFNRDSSRWSLRDSVLKGAFGPALGLGKFQHRICGGHLRLGVPGSTQIIATEES